ncbi:hypothetical protein P4O66_011653, partial [Electrophorus voltai]
MGLIHGGAFLVLDFVFMDHPSQIDAAYQPCTALDRELSDLKSKVEIVFTNKDYSNILHNATMGKLYEDNGKSVGMKFKHDYSSFSGK